jgi:hypothetical protein
LSPFPNLFAPTSAVLYRKSSSFLHTPVKQTHLSSKPSSPPQSATPPTKIYNAVAAGRAEITITPQAWLAARVAGLAPETTQYLASLANRLLLPAPSPNDQLNLGFTLKVSTYETFAVAPKTEHT